MSCLLSENWHEWYSIWLEYIKSGSTKHFIGWAAENYKIEKLNPPNNN